MKKPSKELLNKCICGKCPSYIKCKKPEYAFCFICKSSCIKEENGCICAQCPVTKELRLKNIYYCVYGTEDQMNKNK
ncbi:MAG TPA: DUF2769 domain-containing protein [Candidatus Paceibacterota bacterium]|nr:DUF2769 domain-containing protein [Candidatus Paceibacterota bacterium]